MQLPCKDGGEGVKGGGRKAVEVGEPVGVEHALGEVSADGGMAAPSHAVPRPTPPKSSSPVCRHHFRVKVVHMRSAGIC